MIKKALVFLFGSVLLSIACSEEDNTKNNSATLQISWDKLSDYSYYLFTSPVNNSLQNKSAYYPQNEDTSPQYYTWEAKDINLYAVAIETWATEKYKIYPEIDDQGRLHLKKNNQIIPLESQDLLIATPQQIASGQATTHLTFQYGMSQLKIILELSGAEGYSFNLQTRAVNDGYINMQNGKIIPEGQPNSVYFSQNESHYNEYEAVIIPQQLAKNTILSITGIKSLGEKILRIDYPMAQLTLEENKQYLWHFNVSSSGITYKSFNEIPRLINK